MKIFRTILGRIADKKLASFDFEKMEDTEHIVHYEHKKRRQYLDILRKAHGPAIIQSYDPDLNDQKGIGSTCVVCERCGARTDSVVEKEFAVNIWNWRTENG